jgi:cell division protein FtsL
MERVAIGIIVGILIVIALIIWYSRRKAYINRKTSQLVQSVDKIKTAGQQTASAVKTAVSEVKGAAQGTQGTGPDTGAGQAKK